MSAPYLSDRQRVELALPAAMLYRIFGSCVVEAKEKGIDEREYDERVQAWLSSAAWEPLDGLPLDKARKLASRITRLQQAILAPFEDRPIMVTFLFVLFWLRDLLAEGTLVLVEGSTFDRAVSALIPELERHDDLWAAMEKSAAKNARKAKDRLRAEGYYQGGHAMTVTECLFIPHVEADKYRAAGWDVTSLPMPHAHYSMLATRPVEDGAADWETLHQTAGGLE